VKIAVVGAGAIRRLLGAALAAGCAEVHLILGTRTCGDARERCAGAQ